MRSLALLVEQVVSDEQNCLDCLVAKHFDQAGDQGQALVADRLDAVHFLSLVRDEESRITSELFFLIVLHKQVAAD